MVGAFAGSDVTFYAQPEKLLMSFLPNGAAAVVGGLFGFNLCRSACCLVEVSTDQPSMRLSITSTTGSPVELTVPRWETVEGLRTHISKRLRLQTDRIVLLHRHRQLTTGKLLDLGVTDGSNLTLFPVIEAGLVCSTVRAERNLTDVLESLTEVQISDFLSGRAPLSINLGLGTHVMYVELQLSAQHVTELQWNQEVRTQTTNIISAGSTTSPAVQTSTQAMDFSDHLVQSGLQGPRSTFNSATYTSCSCNAAHACMCCDQSCPCHPIITTSSTNIHTATGCTHPSCPLQTATSVGPPQNPAPASAIKKDDIHASSPAELFKESGAVIESFVSHSPGVYSGTFSGTLAPWSQSGISHHQTGIAIVLQILSDLLKASYHCQGTPHALSLLHFPASKPRFTPLTPDTRCKVKNNTFVTEQMAKQLRKTPGEGDCPLHSSTQENQALHCKVEQLQRMMHQRRRRRQTRRDAQITQAFHLYRKHHHCP